MMKRRKRRFGDVLECCGMVAMLIGIVVMTGEYSKGLITFLIGVVFLIGGAAMRPRRYLLLHVPAAGRVSRIARRVHQTWPSGPVQVKDDSRS